MGNKLDMLEQRIKCIHLPFVRDDVAQMMRWQGDINTYEKIINTPRAEWVSSLSLPFKIVFLYDEIGDNEGYVAIGID